MGKKAKRAAAARASKEKKEATASELTLEDKPHGKLQEQHCVADAASTIVAVAEEKEKVAIPVPRPKQRGDGNQTQGKLQEQHFVES